MFPARCKLWDFVNSGWWMTIISEEDIYLLLNFAKGLKWRGKRVCSIVSQKGVKTKENARLDAKLLYQLFGCAAILSIWKLWKSKYGRKLFKFMAPLCLLETFRFYFGKNILIRPRIPWKPFWELNSWYRYLDLDAVTRHIIVMKLLGGEWIEAVNIVIKLNER